MISWYGDGNDWMKRRQTTGKSNLFIIATHTYVNKKKRPKRVISILLQVKKKTVSIGRFNEKMLCRVQMNYFYLFKGLLNFKHLYMALFIHTNVYFFLFLFIPCDIYYVSNWKQIRLNFLRNWQNVIRKKETNK
jgi:hypothetical protein